VTSTSTPTSTPTRGPLYLPLALRNQPIPPPPTATPTATPTCFDAYEPNDTLVQAYPWPPAVPPPALDFRARFCPAEVRDYYRVRLTAPGEIHVLLSSIPAGSDYGVYLYDSSGAYLYGRFVPGASTQEFTYGSNPPAAAGDYYVQVYAWSNPSATQYRLRVNAP
jgi:hypothetical protein